MALYEPGFQRGSETLPKKVSAESQNTDLDGKVRRDSAVSAHQWLAHLVNILALIGIIPIGGPMAKPKFAAGYHATTTVVELILQEMETQNISVSDLAKKMECQESLIEDFLDTGNNTGIFSLGMLFAAMGKSMVITLEDY